jgi:hypothetical protein
LGRSERGPVCAILVHRCTTPKKWTPKSRPGDFLVGHRPDPAQNRLCQTWPRPRGRKHAGFRGKSHLSKRQPILLYHILRSWLCGEAAANGSPLVKFPDHRENRGNFINLGLIARAWPLETQPVGGENTWFAKQGIFLRKQGVSASQKGNPKVRIWSKSGPSELKRRLLRMTVSGRL